MSADNDTEKSKVWYFTLSTEMHFDEPVSEKECVEALIHELSKTEIKFNAATERKTLVEAVQETMP